MPSINISMAPDCEEDIKTSIYMTLQLPSGQEFTADQLGVFLVRFLTATGLPVPELDIAFDMKMEKYNHNLREDVFSDIEF